MKQIKKQFIINTHECMTYNTKYRIHMTLFRQQFIWQKKDIQKRVQCCFCCKEMHEMYFLLFFKTHWKWKALEANPGTIRHRVSVVASSSSAVTSVVEWLPVSSVPLSSERWNIVYFLQHPFLKSITWCGATHRREPDIECSRREQQCWQGAHHAAIPAARGCSLSYLVLFGLQISQSPLSSL